MVTRGDILWLGIASGVTGGLIGGLMLGVGMDLAVNGRADALVTHNLADFAAAAPRFGLLAIAPAELLRRIRR